MSIKNLQTKIGVNADGKFGKDTLIAAMKFYKLSPERAAHFFAQTSHETGDFSLFTENLKQSCEVLGLVLLDHLIVGNKNYYSFREESELF